MSRITTDEELHLEHERRRNISAWHNRELIKAWTIVFGVLLAIGVMHELTGAEKENQAATYVQWICGGCGATVSSSGFEGSMKCPRCGCPIQGW